MNHQSFAQHRIQVAVAATFTADLVREPLQYWLDQLEIPADVRLAPYAQVLQELLDPTSLLSSTRQGFNVLLIRLEDWLRDRLPASGEDAVEQLARCCSELVWAARALRERTAIPLLIFIAPASGSLPEASARAVNGAERQLIDDLTRIGGVHCWHHSELVRLYPVESVEDPRMDRLGHIPYTSEYFAALATLFARRIAVVRKSQFKVIALDCDDTLWKGVCGEDGAAGVEITPSHRRLQELLVRQHDAGMVLCLCSKNNEKDVDEVFRQRPEMPLLKDHIVAARVNWNAKSDNLRELARELDLALSSFIFIDDSAVECAEVRANCPEVLTLQLPSRPEDAASFLDHVWAFDRTEVTGEARQRTQQYKQNRARRQASQGSADLASFLASLDLKIDISAMRAEHVARVSELTRRTTQFNMTTLMRSSDEVEALLNSAVTKALVVHVRDRFGDYGLVGAVFYKEQEQSLAVETFLLSCRVLGRGVEHRLLNELGRIGAERGLRYVDLTWIETARNAPARAFLERSCAQFRWVEGSIEGGARYRVPVQDAMSLAVGSEPSAQDMQPKAVTSTVSSQQRTGFRWHDIALRLHRPADVLKAVKGRTRARRLDGIEYVAPRNAIEHAIARAWSDILNVEPIGVLDDFLALGGDSLQAVQVISRVASALGREPRLDDFLSSPTIAAMAGRITSTHAPVQPIERAPRSEDVGVSSAQLRLWFMDELEGGSTAYHIPLAFRLQGRLDTEALQASFDGLVQRHEALRTRFLKDQGEPRQVIDQAQKFQLAVSLFGTEGTQDWPSAWLRQQAAEIEAPFDLRTGPLIRGRLIQRSAEDHLLLITMHHIVSDGWSVGVLIQELSSLYAAHRRGQPADLQALAIQYVDYAWWQRQWLQSEACREQLSYWREQLQGAPERLDLPTDRARPAVQSYRGGRVSLALNEALTEELKHLARQSSATLAMILHTGWCIVLSRLSAQRDIVVGVPVANRRRTEFEALIGLFVNSLAIRVRMEDGLTVADLIGRVKSAMLGAYANQDVPFEQVVEAVNPERNLGRSPIFQTMLVLQNTPRGALQLPGVESHELDVPSRSAKFDLVLELQERDGRLVGSLEYAADIFDAATVERIAGYLTNVLGGMARKSSQPALALPLLDARERQLLLETFNDTQANFPRELSVHEVFEAQALHTPEATAICEAERRYSYAQLNCKANQWARYLLRRGAQPGDCIAVVVPRSAELVILQLAILKSGGVYLPIDAELPVERRRFIVEDSGARLVITAGQPSLQDQTASVSWVSVAETEVEKENTQNLGVKVAPQAPAYVMYTSGSTGTPKGVAVPHRAVTRLVINGGYAEISVSDCIAHYSNPTFDASTFEVWGALLNGASMLIVAQSTVLDGARFARLLIEHRVTAMYLSVGLFNRYVEPLADVFRQLRYLMVGGDALDPHTVRRVLRESPPQQLLNVYGPTECTTFASFHRITERDVEAHQIPIGRPISNTQIYVLDEAGQPVPIGVRGEIHIGGDGVACGYLNRAELTAQRFMRNPFRDSPEERIYKTGDVGRWRPDGTLEFLGRNDHQVKIRGFRIELGEIEAQLSSHPAVAECVVVARQDAPGEKRLVAYVVPRQIEIAPSAEALRAELLSVLPEYMIPSAFVMLERFPLTSGGKVDRRALPAPDVAAYAMRTYEPPSGPSEQLLAELWSELLHVARVGRADNFFELGGHSLLAVALVDRLRRQGVATEVRRIFENPVLSQYAKVLELAASEDVAVPANLIPPGCDVITPQMLPLVDLSEADIQNIVARVAGGAENIQDIYPLAPLQEGILFHHLKGAAQADAYVLAGALEFESRQRLDAFIEALQAAVDRYDSLRTAIVWEQVSQPVQVVYRKATLPVDEVELDMGNDARTQVMEWARSDRQWLDLRCAPLVRLRIAADRSGERWPDGRWYALLQLHHVVIDGRSLNALMGEIVARLDARTWQARQAAPYRNHVAQALAYGSTSKAETFFETKLADVEEPTAPFGVLDIDGGSPAVEVREMLDADLAQRLRRSARRLHVSPATLFHSAWSLVVAQTSGRDDVVFGTVLLGRMQGSAGATGTVGMFLNTLPIRLRLKSQSAVDLVRQTQQELVELLAHEQASLAVAQRCSDVETSAPLFTAVLNYRHSFADSDITWPKARGVDVLSTWAGTNYPIMLSVDDLGHDFTISAQTRGIEPERIVRYVSTALRSLTDALEQQSTASALTLTVLPAQEREEVIDGLNATRRDYPAGRLIHELFEEQCERTPEAVAIKHGDRSLTYLALNRAANQLGRSIRSRGIEPDQTIGICLGRSVEMAIGVLAALKAGAAYLPMDPNYPPERLAYMLDDARPPVVLTDTRTQRLLPATSAHVIIVDAQSQSDDAVDGSNISAAQTGVTPANLLYVIYTSGSTGQPKGIAMPHGAMTNLIEWHREHLSAAGGRRVLQFAALSFDVAFQEIFSTLCTGGTLVLLDEPVRKDARRLLQLLKAERVQRLFIPPLMLQSLAEFFANGGDTPESLIEIITAGEQLRISPEIVALVQQLQACSVHNHYGPTETHVVTALTLSGDPTQWPAIPSIGRPVSNTRMYLLNSQRQPVPRGVAGEIYIAGVNVARGYLNRPQLSQERFLRNPFVEDSHALMYKTGDLGRWREDGTIEYLGRNDDQVKIRGFRIELGEIETKLAKHPAVKDVAVTARADASGAKRLIAYVTARAGVAPTAAQLRAHLQEMLPEHMVPSGFVVLDSLPMTPSGKLNRRALPMPDLTDLGGENYEPPQGQIEEQLARIWKDVLGIERPGRNDNFFALGGHSLLVLKLVAKIESTFKRPLAVPDVYSGPTLKALAERLSGNVLEQEFVDQFREAELDDSIGLPAGDHAIAQEAILLTGATRFVGGFLLAQLLEDTRATVYCPVVAASSSQATAEVKAGLMRWDLWRPAFEGRIVGVIGNPSDANLGMDEDTYRQLCDKIDTVFHSEATMNILSTYELAKPVNVDPIRELLRFASRSRRKLINHVSTVGVFSRAIKDPMRVISEETTIENERYVKSRGYVASRWVAEKLLLNARERGMPSNIFRVGLIWADSKQGRYDQNLFGYAILKSCLLSGYGITNYSYAMPPTPIDYVARSIAWLGTHRENGVFHISSSRQNLDNVFERSARILGRRLECSSYYQWIGRIKQLHEAGRSMPMVPLVQFAFSLDEDRFDEYQRSFLSAVNCQFDLTRTHRELERAGVIAPIVDERMLRLCIQSMLARDTDFHDAPGLWGPDVANEDDLERGVGT